jgi:hypothetical protein
MYSKLWVTCQSSGSHWLFLKALFINTLDLAQEKFNGRGKLEMPLSKKNFNF